MIGLPLQHPPRQCATGLSMKRLTSFVVVAWHASSTPTQVALQGSYSMWSTTPPNLKAVSEPTSLHIRPPI